MTEPTTPNIGLIVPNTGDLAGTWGSAALNPDFLALDGYQAGVAAISATGTITLTAPAGFTATPSAGPTQSQNSLIRFTGALTGNVTVTFPLPGYYIIENLCTNIGSFYVQLLSGGGGNKIGAPPNKKCHIFNDGTNMDYVNLGDPGSSYDLCGWTTYPPWMQACSFPPYLIKDGSTRTAANWPGLFAAIGYTYGGSGASFLLPDELGRVRAGFDTVGTGRLQGSVCGVQGTTLGSAGGNQEPQQHNHSVSLGFNDPGHTHLSQSTTAGSGNSITWYGGQATSNFPATQSSPTGITFNPSIGNTFTGGSANVQPVIVSALPLIKT